MLSATDSKHVSPQVVPGPAVAAVGVEPLSLPSRRGANTPACRRGFSLTELLVVIGIIVLLVGLLLVALGKVQGKARRTQTESVLQQFANACAAFQAENGRYPGVIPEVVLAGNPQITSTENALLDLLGGFRVLAPTDDTTPDSAAEVAYNAFVAQLPAVPNSAQYVWNVGSGTWRLAVDLGKIGEGPVINGKPRAPYFTPGPSDLARAKYPPATANPPVDLPDLIDAWGQPVLYVRQLRDRGPLVADPSNTPAPQFLRGGILPYIQTTALGEAAVDQTNFSILNTAPDVNLTLARLLEHPAISGQARGGFCVISAGEDGVFYSKTDGPGSDGTPIDDIVTNTNPEFNNPKVVDTYDDIRVFGGA